jgi:hypothetical protein
MCYINQWLHKTEYEFVLLNLFSRKPKMVVNKIEKSSQHVFLRVQGTQKTSWRVESYKINDKTKNMTLNFFSDLNVCLLSIANLINFCDLP